MKNVTPVEKLVYEEEADEIGGMIILLLGEPGSGKTMALTRMVMMDLGMTKVAYDYSPERVERTPLWRGQKTCQWLVPAAQGIPVTLWMHDSVTDYQFYTTGSLKKGIDKRKLDIEKQEGLDVNIKRFEEPSEIIENIDVTRLNVYFIPGSNGSEKEKYFFQKTNLELGEAMVSRSYSDHITWNVDEIENVAPDYNRKPFYELQMQDYPRVWQDLRKSGVSKRGTGHGYGEINWKFYDLKANGIIYMQGGRVHKKHGKINQNAVNNMEKGQAVVPAAGYEPATFDMPNKPENVFSWLSENMKLEMSYEADIPDVRPEPDVNEWMENQPFDKDDLDELIDANETAEIMELNSRTIKKKFQKGELPAIKLNGKWFSSMDELVDREDIPS